MNAERLASMRQAAAKREHGCRARYMAGCRCLPCRAANARYEAERLTARAAGDWNGVVDAGRARRHLRKLSRQGVGRRAVSDSIGVAASILGGISKGDRKRLRRRTERLILAADRSCVSDHGLVPADRTWRLIDELIRIGGFSRAEIARRMGLKTRKLQLGKVRILASTARKFERFHYRYIREDR